jgi:hypothetical protein
MNTHRFTSIEEALGSLPREAQPGRDLWPAIARRMAAAPGSDRAHAMEARRAPWPMALAASVGVLALAGALSWSVLQERARVEQTARRTVPASPGITLASLEPPQDAAYVAARAALERTFNERLNLLAPATQARIRADLALIRKANQDISAALAQDPASPVLWQLLRGAWQQEIDLYKNIARSTEPMLRRT